MKNIIVCIFVDSNLPCVFQSATLLSGQEQPERRLSVSEDSGSEDEEKLDLSSTKT